MVKRIDIHTHLRTPGAVPSEDEMATMIRLARRHGITRAVALGNIRGAQQPTVEDIKAINDNTMAATRNHPEFFIGFCYLNPAHPVEFCLAEIERCVVQGGMRGLKFLTAVRANDRRLHPLGSRAPEFNQPV